MRRATVEYEHCLQKRGAGQKLKVGMGRKTSRRCENVAWVTILKRKAAGMVVGGGSAARRHGAEVVGDVRWGERLHGCFEDVRWVRILNERRLELSWAAARRRWSDVTRGRTVLRGAWYRQQLNDDMR
jgi:hypothetical protein